MREIDFVITWVDMNDPAWQKSFSQYSDKIDNSVNELSEARFRDYGLLRYWFRGVEKFAPWVRYIHFVTCGQKPAWLDVNHPKLKIVNHEDYIPQQYLPVFNSNLIEIYMHNIPELSEQFVYFNDDVFVVDNVPKTRFFRDGLPNDIAAFRTNFGISQFEKMLKNNLRLINKHFDKQEVLNKDYAKWFDTSYGKKGRMTRIFRYGKNFLTLRTPHNAQPFLRRTFIDLWDKCGEELREMSTHRFRSDDDYTPELIRTWQICNSDFNSYNTYQDTKMFPLLIKSKKAIKAVCEQHYSLVCLNDNVHIRDYQAVMDGLKSSFEFILPEKSSFEL